MKSNKMMAARRKLVRILPRDVLEHMSGAERPHMLTMTQLVEMSVTRWDLHEVKEAVNRIFMRADPEGAGP